MLPIMRRLLAVQGTRSYIGFRSVAADVEDLIRTVELAN